MLSKKLTLSLTFLVMVLAIGLVVTPTFGHDPDAGGTFAATFTPGELMDDVSTVDHADITDIQVESGRHRGSAYPAPVPNGRIGTWYQINGTEAAGGVYAAPAAPLTPLDPFCPSLSTLLRSCSFMMLKKTM